MKMTKRRIRFFWAQRLKEAMKKRQTGKAARCLDHLREVGASEHVMGITREGVIKFWTEILEKAIENRQRDTVGECLDQLYKSKAYGHEMIGSAKAFLREISKGESHGQPG